MKRILSTALAIVMFVAASQAQTGDQPKGPHGHGRGDLYKELNLTADQQAKMKSIREAEKKEMDALKSDGKTDADKAARKTIHEKYRSQMESVLTAEQKAKWSDARKDGFAGRGNRGDAMGRGEGLGRMNGMAKDLDLTADQKSKMQTINGDFKTKMEALRNNQSLTSEQRRTQMKQLADEHHNSLKAILTPEQVAKLEQKHKGYKGKAQNSNL